jgi:mono/diheme cytochrome c family protein
MSQIIEGRVARTLYRNLKVLTFLTLVLLGALALAPAKSYFKPWREVQNRYNDLAGKQGLAEITPALHQIWRPELQMADRCTSCHLGMGRAKPLAAGKSALFARHPEVHHDVSQMGCTICHQGQGRATSKVAAHGQVKHWEEPMLPRAHLQASCGACHGAAIKVPPMKLVERGAYLFDLHGCLACHKVDGKGGVVGPDLSGVALKGYDRSWHIKHLKTPAKAVEGSRMMSFGHLRTDEINAILAYLETLVGAPRLVRGKVVAVRQGCRGCHAINGLGGDTGPDLSEIGGRALTRFDFTRVKGPKTKENWFRQHLQQPARVAPGSRMPPQKLSTDDERDLITYLLSLRRPKVPLKVLPPQTRLAALQKARDFAPGGAPLFDNLCTACHGAAGEGKVMKQLGTTVPGVFNADFLAVASDDYLRLTLTHGRTGRDMTAWGGPGGLKKPEVDALVAQMRSHQPAPPSWKAVSALVGQADLTLGQRTFRHDCSGCHGLDGVGTDIAPSLVNAELLHVANDRYLYQTIVEGRPNTAMPAHPQHDARRIAAVIRWLRSKDDATRKHSFDRTLAETLRVSDPTAYRATGSPAYGKVLFTSMCAGCHGTVGQGGVGPAISNPHFLRVASDGFLAGSILLGRGQRAMRSFGPHGVTSLRGREVGDVITYLRHVSAGQLARNGGFPRSRKVQGVAAKGKRSFAQLCVGCHGDKGKGGTAPALNNQDFLRAATDGFLQATIARGRRGTAMRAWARGGFGFAELDPKEINSIVAHVRSWQRPSGR